MKSDRGTQTTIDNKRTEAKKRIKSGSRSERTTTKSRADVSKWNVLYILNISGFLLPSSTFDII